MAEIKLKSEPIRPNWYASDEFDSNARDPKRRIASRQHVWRPPTDVYVNETSVVVRVEIAGMRDGEFSITLDDQYLMIRGFRSEIQEQRAYQQMEIRFGEFRTEVELPSPIKSEEVQAEYQDGFLFVTLAKDKPERISIGQ